MDSFDEALRQYIEAPVDAVRSQFERCRSLAVADFARKRELERHVSDDDRGRNRQRQVANAIRGAQHTTLESIDEEGIRRKQRCTVCVTNLAMTATREDLEDLFRSCGLIQEVTLLMDKNTRRSRGIAYVEFKDMSAVLSALAFHNTAFREQTVCVARPSRDLVALEKARVQRLSSVEGHIVVSNVVAEAAIAVDCLLRGSDPLTLLEVVPATPEGTVLLIMRTHTVHQANEAVAKYDRVEVSGRRVHVERVVDWHATTSSAFVLRGLVDAIGTAAEADELRATLLAFFDQYARVLHIALAPQGPELDVFVQTTTASQATACIAQAYERFQYRQFHAQKVPLEIYCPRFGLKW